MNVLRKINKLRDERDWSIYRLSVESGVSQSTLTNMFNRRTLPSITTLECICSAFGMTMSEFFEEEKPIDSEAAEKELLSLYRSSSSEAKIAVLSLLRELSKN